MLLYGLLGMREAVLNAAVRKSASIFVPAISYRLYGLSRKACSKKTAASPSKSVPRKWYGCLGKHATSCCTDSALEIVPNLPWTVCKLCCTDLLKYCLGMCAKLLPPSPHCLEISLALLLSFSQSAHERIESNVIFFSFSSLNITPNDFWVIQVTFRWSLNLMAEIDLDQWLRLNAHLNLTFYFLIHPTLITVSYTHLTLPTIYSV